MTRLFIPEIGITFTLLEEWSFKLYNEYRNRDLWTVFKGDEDAGVIAHYAKVKAVYDETVEIIGRGVVRVIKGWQGYTYKSTTPQPADQERYDALNMELGDLRQIDPFISVRLPVGTRLTIDRIYIRKGASDYSSLSFYIESCSHPALERVETKSGFKKGRKRFWAKLVDVNCISMEVNHK